MGNQQSQSQRREQEEGHNGDAGESGEIAGGEGAEPFAGMLAVRFEVEQIIDDVGGRGAETKAEEGQYRRCQNSASPRVGEEERKEDEDVFRPLMEPDRLEPCLERGGLFVEGADRGDAGFAQRSAKAGGGVRDHRLLTLLQEREVRQGVADVREIFAKAGLEGGELVFAGEVERAVGGEDASEQAEVGGDAVCGVGVGGRGEVDGTAGGALLFKILKEFPIVGEMGDVELNGVGEVTLEGGFSLQQPARHLEYAAGLWRATARAESWRVSDLTRVPSRSTQSTGRAAMWSAEGGWGKSVLSYV